MSFFYSFKLFCSIGFALLKFNLGKVREKERETERETEREREREKMREKERDRERVSE